jgi:hypothetical protein
MFGLKPTRKKPSANPYIIGLFWVVAFMAALFITLLSLVPIAESSSFNEEDFKVAITLGERVVYEGDLIQIAVMLSNQSENLHVVDLNGGCQATYAIYDQSNNKVFPRYAEEKPCNNSGYETFYIYPTQRKYYQFELGGKVLPVGKYTAVGYIDGIGSSSVVEFEVVEKPNFFAQEYDLCEGATGKICDYNAGLSCQHVGGFPFGAGMCLPKYSSFTPQDKCKNGVQNCFNDTENHPQNDVIDEYSISGKLSAFGTDEFRPDDPMEVKVFEQLISEYTGKKITINTSDKFIQRDTAIEVLHRAYINNQVSGRTLRCPFTDIENNPKKPYIVSAYKKGLISENGENKFYPNEYLTRAHALVLIDRFEKFRG